MRRPRQDARRRAQPRHPAEQLAPEQPEAAGAHAQEQQDAATRAGRAHAEPVDVLPHAARERRVPLPLPLRSLTARAETDSLCPTCRRQEPPAPPRVRRPAPVHAPLLRPLAPQRGAQARLAEADGRPGSRSLDRLACRRYVLSLSLFRFPAHAVTKPDEPRPRTQTTCRSRRRKSPSSASSSSSPTCSPRTRYVVHVT